MAVNEGYVKYFHIGALAYPSSHYYLLVHIYQKTRNAAKIVRVNRVSN